MTVEEAEAKIRFHLSKFDYGKITDYRFLGNSQEILFRLLGFDDIGQNDRIHTIWYRSYKDLPWRISVCSMDKLFQGATLEEAHMKLLESLNERARIQVQAAKGRAKRARLERNKLAKMMETT